MNVNKLQNSEQNSRKVVISKTEELINRAGTVVKPVRLTEKDFENYLDRKSGLVVFIIIALIGAIFASWSGLAIPKIVLQTFSDNSIMGLFLYIGFLITVTERIAEIYRLNFRSAAKQRKAEQLKYYLDSYDESDRNEKITNAMRHLKIHTITTQRRMLQITFTIGFVFSAIGSLQLIHYFIYEEYVGAEWMAITIDTVDILLCSALVAGGSKGWNSIVKGITDIFAKRA